MSAFVDTSFFVALLSRGDQHHAAALRLAAGWVDALVTSDWVLTEVANFLREPRNRPVFASLLRELQHDARVQIVSFSTDLQTRAIALYVDRPDKSWSPVDCASFVVMQEQSLTRALTADHHFEQAGFTALLT